MEKYLIGQVSHHGTTLKGRLYKEIQFKDTSLERRRFYYPMTGDLKETEELLLSILDELESYRYKGTLKCFFKIPYTFYKKNAPEKKRYLKREVDCEIRVTVQRNGITIQPTDLSFSTWEALYK